MPETDLTPFSVEPHTVYSKAYITKAMRISNDTWTKWKARGLKRLNTNTKTAHYLGQDLIEIWRKED